MRDDIMTACLCILVDTSDDSTSRRMSLQETLHSMLQASARNAAEGLCSYMYSFEKKHI
jgi:hypothetical protein